MASKKDAVGPATSAPIEGADEEMIEVHGQFGGSVDGWWSPPPDDTDSFTGILVNFIDKKRSEKLQSNSLVFETIEGANNVKNGGSDKVPGAKGDGKLHKVGKGVMVAIPEWKQLLGFWPAKAGHKFTVTRGAKRSIGKGRSMYDIKVMMSKNAVRSIEITEDTTSDEATGGVEQTPSFQVEAE